MGASLRDTAWLSYTMYPEQKARGEPSGPSSSHREAHTATSSSRSTTSAAQQQQLHSSSTAAPAGGCMASPRNYGPPDPVKPAPQAAAKEPPPVGQHYTLPLKEQDGCGGHGSKSEGASCSHCTCAGLPQEQAKTDSASAGSYVYSNEYTDDESDEEDSTESALSALLSRDSSKQQAKQPAVRHQSFTNPVPVNSHKQGNIRVLATNLPAETISKYWWAPILLWRNGSLVAEPLRDASGLLVHLPRVPAVYMFQARAPDANGWINLSLGKAVSGDALQKRVQAYFQFNQGTITLDSDEEQKHHAMLSLQHRGFDVRLLYKITRVYTAAESEAKKLREFKFPFDKLRNGHLRCVNPYIEETDKRVTDYRDYLQRVPPAGRHSSAYGGHVSEQ